MNMMMQKLEAIEQGLRVWRGVILSLTMIMLFISLLSDDQMVMLVLIICFFALILFQLRSLPASSYQLFILLLVAYFIYTVGHFLEGFYDRKKITFAYVSKNIYDMFTIIAFVVVLWRHYQKDSLVRHLQSEDNDNIF